MHEIVLPEFKPAMYDCCGRQVAFSQPTKKISKPRIHFPSSRESDSTHREAKLRPRVQEAPAMSKMPLPECQTGKNEKHRRRWPAPRWATSVMPINAPVSAELSRSSAPDSLIRK